MQTKRIAPGIYDLVHNGRTFEVEKTPLGDWQLGERLPDDGDQSGRFEYWNNFATLHDAKQAVKEAA